MTGQNVEMIRGAVASALAKMTPDQMRNLAVGPYLDVRSGLTMTEAA